jgi:DivIVA domain-containing protein
MRKNKADGAEVDDGGARRVPSGSGAAGRLTPLDIQQVEFRRSFKGYDEREVDEFLDRLTEDFAAALDEAQRLRGAARIRAYGRLDVEVARREAPLAAYANLNARVFLSSRVGCVTYQPVYGLDVAGICLHARKRG